MSHGRMNRKVIVLAVTLAMVLAGCAGDETVDTTAAPVATTAVTTATTLATTTTLAEVIEAVDVVAVADTFLSTIPEGWMAIKDVEGFKDAVDNGGAYVIDVREASEYAEGHIPGAVNIPIREITKSLDQIPTDQLLVVYCKSGYRAALSTAALRMLGYENVKAFGPSYAGWTEAGEEVAMDMVTPVAVTVPMIDPTLLAAVESAFLNMPEGYLGIGDAENMQSAVDAGLFILDVREESEFVEGRIPGAINIPLRTLASRVAELPTDQQIIVYCASGHRAAIAGATLNILGMDNVRVFGPSYKGWTAADKPTEA